MDGIEGSPPPHSDYEDDFADASLGQESYGKDEEDTYEISRMGIRDIILMGMVCHFFFHQLHPWLWIDSNHSTAWGRFTHAFMEWFTCACACLGKCSHFIRRELLIRCFVGRTNPWGQSK